MSFVIEPIGYARAPFVDKASAPRQAVVARGVEARIELLPGHGYEDALADLASFSHVWVLFWFDRAEGFRPKVSPPRSAKKRGVFATRAPHRPNPIGLSLATLVGVEGLVVHVRDVDWLDMTPVLDLKPYVPYADVAEGASSGWLSAPDEGPRHEVVWSEEARADVEWVHAHAGVDLVAPLGHLLSLGPAPHAYRRIQREGDGFVIAWKAWRARFTVDGAIVRVTEIRSGYRPRELAVGEGPDLELHRAFVARATRPADPANSD